MDSSEITQPGGDAYLRVIQILAEAPDLQVVAADLVEAIANVFGWPVGTLWLVDESERLLRPIAGWSARGIDAAEFEEAGQRLQFERGEGLPGRVWATGHVAWVEDLLDDENFPRRRAAAGAGLRSAVAFPVEGSGVVGVFEFFASAIRPPDDGVVAAMSTLGRQVGQAIERRRTEELLRASEEVKATVIGAALDCVITMDAAGHVVDFNPAAERTFGYSREHAIGEELASLIIPPELQDQHRAGLRRVLGGASSPILNRRIELTGRRASGEEFPVELTVVRARGGADPLFAGFIRDISQRKDAEERQQRLLAAEQEARVRAEAAERRARELASTLQQSLVPPQLPTIPGLEAAARFRAGGEAVDVGGDFYDVVNTRPNGWGLVVGDVCGKGPEAATVAGLARYTVRAIVLREARPSEVLTQLNEALLAHSDRALTSAIYLEMDGPEMRLAIAGHPRPLLVDRDGRVTDLGVTGTILGFTPQPRLENQSFRLNEGELLLLYTDGVTEIRTPAGRLGTEALKRSLAECAGASPTEVVDHLLERIVDRGDYVTDDDVALVALRPS